jgi:hypothetical protein
VHEHLSFFLKGMMNLVGKAKKIAHKCTSIRRPSSGALKRIENKCFKEAIHEVVPSKKKMSQKGFKLYFTFYFHHQSPIS